MLKRPRTRKLNQYYDTKDYKLLAEGGFGKVFRMWDIELKRFCVIKEIPIEKPENIKEFEDEVKIMQRLDHPNVCRIYEYFEDETNCYIVSEYCEGGTLEDFVIS